MLFFDIYVFGIVIIIILEEVGLVFVLTKAAAGLGAHSIVIG